MTHVLHHDGGGVGEVSKERNQVWVTDVAKELGKDEEERERERERERGVERKEK